MKIAYCLTGLVDSESETILGLNDVSDRIEVDFFCHTWDDPKNPGKSIIDNYPFAAIKTSPYKEFEEHILSLPNIETLYKKANSGKDIHHFVRTHLAQFYSTIHCIQLALDHGARHPDGYDLLIKARSNLRFEKGLASAFPKNAETNIVPVLKREPRAWYHFQQPDSDDRPNTIWDNWPECIQDVSTVFSPSFTFPLWQYGAPFLDSLFGMEPKFAKEHILHEDFLINIIDKFIYFADNIDTLAMEADKVWFKYLMDNRVAIFGLPLDIWMTREKKIII
jgi:hypothetical protein